MVCMRGTYWPVAYAKAISEKAGTKTAFCPLEWRHLDALGTVHIMHVTLQQSAASLLHTEASDRTAVSSFAQLLVTVNCVANDADCQHNCAALALRSRSAFIDGSEMVACQIQRLHAEQRRIIIIADMGLLSFLLSLEGT